MHVLNENENTGKQVSLFSLWGFRVSFSVDLLAGTSSVDLLTGKSFYSEILSCESKGPVTFNNRKGCCTVGLAARAHYLSAQLPMATVVTDREALS